MHEDVWTSWMGVVCCVVLCCVVLCCIMGDEGSDVCYSGGHSG